MTLRSPNCRPAGGQTLLPLLSACLLGLVAPTADAQIYRSVGADGRPVYSDVAPSSDKTTVRVLKTEPAPLATEPPRSRDETKEAARRKALEDKESRQIRERQAATEAARICDAARNTLKELERVEGRPVYLREPNGERTFISDEQRGAARSRAQQAVAQNCP